MGYLPSLGTFSRRDPLGTEFQDGMNIYAFARSNPNSNTDPSGEASSTAKTTTGINTLDSTGDYLKQGANGIVTGGAAVSLDALINSRDAGNFGVRAADILYAECPKNTWSEYREAARHMYWQALLANQHGDEAARYAGNAHEVTEAGSLDSQRDSENNNSGRSLAKSIPKPPVFRLNADGTTRSASEKFLAASKARRRIAEQLVLDAIRAGHGTGLKGKMKCCNFSSGGGDF